jgi:hypothetical protein
MRSPPRRAYFYNPFHRQLSMIPWALAWNIRQAVYPYVSGGLYVVNDCALVQT